MYNNSLSMTRLSLDELKIMEKKASGRGPRSNYGGDYGGNIVDENMIVLRMRIQERKMLERRNKTPSIWMEWEKKYYANNGYNEDVCEVLGFLQNYLINNRPTLALGLIALVALSLIISTGVALFHAIQTAQLMISIIWVISFLS
ncbi:hypothetical protein EZV62_004935 [Acer yangbiense]|uniref:Uncharacterized protein n=1 Tax=Acer yangbiense TaxID=1000413 RepID=A0A5C7ILI3_9ROSI|nr:hypothetical protein EZV62_004935 [Acer yangbiense]